MSKLTLEEAISHCLEVAEQNDAQAEKWQEEGGEEWGKTTACRECAADHRQLAEWLTDFKGLREKQESADRQIAEYKRLLKAAVNDLNFESQCRNCKHKEYGLNTICKECRGNKYEWRYADEALKLIGDDDK